MKIKIIHVAQTHHYALAKLDDIPIPTYERRNLFEQVARSQFKVAQTIKKYPECPIVVEGLDFNMSSSSVSGTDQARLKRIFPKGLPNRFETMTAIQKSTFYTEGAANILFNLGEIPTLYRSSDFNGELAKAKRRLAEPLDHNDSAAMENRYNGIKELDILRETEAIEYAIEAMLLNYHEKTKISTEGAPPLDTRVLLVYGAAHDFKRYSERRYSKTLEKKVEVTVEVIDCSASTSPIQQTPSQGVSIRRSPTLNTNNLFFTKALIISAVISSVLSIGVGIALMLTGFFAPFGVGLMGLSITGVVSALMGVGLGVGFYMIGQKIKSCFGTIGEDDIPPMSFEPSKRSDNLLGLTSQHSYPRTSMVLSSRSKDSTILLVPVKNEPVLQDNTQKNLSIRVAQLTSEGSELDESQTDELRYMA